MGDAREQVVRGRPSLKKAARRRPTGAVAPGSRRSAERHLRALFDSLDDELMVVDTDLNITQANVAVLKRHGASEGIIGRRCYEVSHGLQEPCSSPECECPVQKVLVSGKPERVTHVHKVLTRTGAEDRYVDIIATPVTDSQGNIVEVVELMRDTTETRRLEHEIVEANRTLRALNAIAGALIESGDLDSVLEIVLDNVMDVLRVNLGAIMLVDSESQTLSHCVHRGLSEKFVQGIGELALGEGIVGKVALLGEPVILDDVSQCPGVARPELVSNEGHRGFCSIPLQAKDRVLGVLNVGTSVPRRFSPAEVQLLTGIASQIAIAIENRMLYGEIQRKEEMRGELLRQLIAAQEEERKRISRELHDETSQALTGLAVAIEVVIDSLPLGRKELEQRLRKAQSIALGTLEGIHAAIYELRPSLLDDLGLAAALRCHAEAVLEAAGIEVGLQTIGQERRLPADTETALFRIFQEAATNIIRHSRASSAGVVLHFTDDSVAITIEDDGFGFDHSEVLKSRGEERGLGLLGMRERAEFLGGSFAIRSGPGRGTRIRVEVPSREQSVRG